MPTDQDRRDAKYNRFYLETLNGPMQRTRRRIWIAVALALLLLVLLVTLL